MTQKELNQKSERSIKATENIQKERNKSEWEIYQPTNSKCKSKTPYRRMTKSCCGFGDKFNQTNNLYLVGIDKEEVQREH